MWRLVAAVLWVAIARSALVAASGYYTIVASTQIRANSEFHVAVSLHDADAPASIRLTIENGVRYLQSKEVAVQPFRTTNVLFETGVMPDPTDSGYKLIAEGISGVSFRNETYLQLNEKRFSVLVQTDKALYKPGDLVRFRVLLLDPNTKPLDAKSDMQVRVLDGKMNRIKQWGNVTTANGVFSGELQLSSFPVLGNWMVSVDALGETKQKMFEVAEYVLPTFEVSIETQKEVVYKDDKIRATIRAKYTYGKPVRGEATVTLQPKIYGSYQPFASDLLVRKVAKLNGKGIVEFDINSDLKLTEEYFRELQMDAVVEEELTGRKQIGKTVINIRKSKFYIKNINNVDNFKPGLPYEIVVQVMRFDGMPVQDTSNDLEMSFSWEGILNNGSMTEAKKLDANGQARFVKVFPRNGTLYTLKATYLDVTEGLGRIHVSESSSGVHIQLKVLTENPTIGKSITVDVQSSVPMTYLTYQILGRGDILDADTVPVSDRSSHQLKFLATLSMVPKAEMIVYFLQDGQMVSSRIEVSMGGNMQNTITVDSSSSQARPGQSVDITVTTRPNAFVGLMGIDQSVLVLKSGNDLDIDDVFAELNEYSEGYFRPYHHHPGVVRGPDRVKRQSRFAYNKAAKDFTSAGAVLMSNIFVPQSFSDSPSFDPLRNEIPHSPTDILISKKADIGPAHVFRTNTKPPLAGPYAFSRIPQPKWKRQRVRLEHAIENTWLFANARAGSNGVLTLPKKVPDTITSWVITGFSVDPVTGLALTKSPTKVQVFQPFFVSLNLPYSIKRGEVLSIPIVVFNYMDSSLNAEVTLHNEDRDFDFVEVSNEVSASPKVELYRRKRVAVKSNDGSAIAFMIRPKKVGPITIKVTATSPLAGDGIERILSVEPEGAVQFVNKAFFVDLRDKSQVAGNLTVEIPKNAVPDSTHVEVSVIGDILGQTIKNLDSLIRLPFGCGEQNMLHFVPNIVALEYLKNTNHLTDAIEVQAKRYMDIGYQQELSYKHMDGSYSAFGETDRNGSTWLTAFVAKSFLQASRYIDVEQKVIDDALSWLASVQAPNGSFPEVGNVIHKGMQGGTVEGIALTAYTLIAFLENKSRIPTHRNAINKAMDYIVRNLETLDDTYAMALAAYALQLADHNAKDFVLRTLDSKAILRDGQKHWMKPIVEAESKNVWYSRPNSINTEMTAYALMALLPAGSYTDVIPIMKWLLSQRNDQGGFESTQDTIVGLQALAKVAEKMASRGSNVQVAVKYGEGLESRMGVSAGNAMVYQQYELPSNIKVVNITATGQGFALVQLSYKYNLNVTGAWPRFTLDPQINRNSNADYLHLTVCTSFIASEDTKQSNMAVMEVQFPSGFTADLETIPSLEANENVKLVETKNGDTVMIIYFESLSAKEQCPTVDAYRTHKVAMQRPAAVTVYDYYDSSRKARMFYKVRQTTLCDICEADDCTESCSIRASEQRSGSETTADVTTKSAASIVTMSSVGLVIILTISMTL